MIKIKPSISKLLFGLVLFAGVSAYFFVVYFDNLEGGINLAPGLCLLFAIASSLFVLGFILEIVFGSITVDSTTLKYSSLFRSKKVLIKEIYNIEMRFDARVFRLIFEIKKPDGSTYEFMVPNVSDYGNKKLGAIFSELVKVNPQINLSDGVQKIMNGEKLTISVPKAFKSF